MNRCHCTAVSCSVRVIWPCQKLTVDSKEFWGDFGSPGVSVGPVQRAPVMCLLSPPQRLHHRTGLSVHSGDRFQRGAPRQHHALQGRPLPRHPSSRQLGLVPITQSLWEELVALCIVLCEKTSPPGLQGVLSQALLDVGTFTFLRPSPSAPPLPPLTV